MSPNTIINVKDLPSGKVDDLKAKVDALKASVKK
jgi:hypothetical protein